MRTEIQAEQVRIATATIFNQTRSDAEPAADFYELGDEESSKEDRQAWKAIETAVQKLPADALAALVTLLDDRERAADQGYVRGLVLAARVAHRRWQTELARDLLIEAGIKSLDDLNASAANSDDIIECRAIFKDWTPSQEQVWAAKRRIHPMPTGVATPRDVSCQ
ncbi:MAG: hypothetical protein AB7F09_06555 [Parvibaculaceae bacterium]